MQSHAPASYDPESKPVVEGLESVHTNEKGEIASSQHADALAGIDDEPVKFDLAASKRLARKMDIHNVPIVALCYLFAFIDRTNM
jgi:hypothetical protein